MDIKKKKKFGELVKGPWLKFFPGVDYPRLFEGVSGGCLFLFCVLSFLLPSGIV